MGLTPRLVSLVNPYFHIVSICFKIKIFLFNLLKITLDAGEYFISKCNLTREGAPALNWSFNKCHAMTGANLSSEIMSLHLDIVLAPTSDIIQHIAVTFLMFKVSCFDD